jgi:hypothetical protein
MDHGLGHQAGFYQVQSVEKREFGDSTGHFGDPPL